MKRRMVCCALLAIALFLLPKATHARWMDPNTGRFQTMDPYEGDQESPQTLHRYAYAGDDPVNKIDPRGEDAVDIMTVADLSGMLDSFTSIAGSIKKFAVGGGAPGNGHTTVHIWSYRGKNEAWGHASMTLDDQTPPVHISWWPSGVGRQAMPFLPNIYSAPARDPQTFADDVSLEGQPPDKDIVITSLNEAKIVTWWNGFKPTHLWKTLSQNCSTTVADGLKAGDASSAHSIWGAVRLQWTSHDIVWTPADVEAYANAINQYH